MRDDSPLTTILINFTLLSIFTIGGMNAAIPELHRQVVEVNGWMSDQRFADLFAIAQAAPGPNIIVVTLIGWEVAGLAGALAATLAILGPTSLLAYGVGHVWHRFRHAPWRIAIQAGVTPITVGLVVASGYLLARAVDTSLTTLAITIAAAAVLYLTRLHPLVCFAAAAALGAAGLL